MNSNKEINNLVKQDMQQLKGQTSALQLHVSRFSRDGFFSPSTVAEGLEKIHEPWPKAKGSMIAAFNSVHSGNITCPFGSTAFTADPVKGYAKYLHLGTTRIWNPDGSINEARWEQFINTVAESHNLDTIIRQSSLMSYLNACYHNDQQEAETARNTNSWFSSGIAQATAATQAWHEVFDRLTCGWIYNEATNEMEPYITQGLVRLFFENSELAFLAAEQKELPVLKPSHLDGYSSI